MGKENADVRSSTSAAAFSFVLLSNKSYYFGICYNYAIA
jgi:hypothetical protein